MSKFDPYDHLNVVLNPDGSLTRYVQLPTTPATGENPGFAAGQSAVSKDVVLNAGNKTWMRLYRPVKLPSNDKSVARLPIIIYFHGGAWIQLSVAQNVIHESLNKLSSEVPAIVVGVEYRLAPENRLPAQYEDAVEAVHWVKNQALDRNNGEKWLKEHGDFSRCYLYGISCGANIAFNAAIRLSDTKLDPIVIAGVIMNQPFFGGKKRTKTELKLATDQFLPLPVIDLQWELALPEGADRDHRYCNPFVDNAYKEKIKSLGRSLVIGFGGDPLIERQQELVQILTKQGVMVEARFDDIGFHGIEMIDNRRASAIINFIKEFV